MHWQLELQEPEVSEATLAAWMTWRQAHPLHEHAWQRAEAFAQRMSDIRSPDQRQLAHAALRADAVATRGAQATGRCCWRPVPEPGPEGHALWCKTGAPITTARSANNGASRWPITPKCSSTPTAQSTWCFEQKQRRIKLLRGELLVTRDRSPMAAPVG